MPQLGQYKWISDTVFYLYPSAQDALEGSAFGGTGFFVGVESKKHGRDYYHIHGVTNWHVACRGASVIRINRVDGGTDVLEFGPDEWTFLPGGHDIAISPPLDLNKGVHKVEAIWAGSLMTQGEFQAQDIGAAEDVFMVGRFIDYAGTETNEPAYRFGNISIANATLRQPTGFFGRSLVIDMHSRTGYSGSPIYVYRTSGSVFHRQTDIATNWHYVRLLGIHWGQFPERWDIKEQLPSNPAAQASLVVDGKYVEGLSGMTCAAPSYAILDLLLLENLVEMRAINDDRVSSDMLLRPRSTASVQASSSQTRRILARHLGLDRFNPSTLS